MKLMLSLMVRSGGRDKRCRVRQLSGEGFMIIAHFLRGVAMLLPAALLLWPTSGMAADKLSGGDTAWILTSTALVLFMTLPGLALFYAGLVRANSVLSVLMHCFAICCVASIVWLVIGYSLAFGDGGNWNAFIGINNFVHIVIVNKLLFDRFEILICNP